MRELVSACSGEVAGGAVVAVDGADLVRRCTDTTAAPDRTKVTISVRSSVAGVPTFSDAR
jgi:hypothetical protein